MRQFCTANAVDKAELVPASDYHEISIEDYRDLVKNPEDEEKIKTILEEYEFLKYTTDEAPRSIPPKFMLELMTSCHSKMSRHRHFQYLRTRELDIAEEKRQKRIFREQHEKMLSERKVYPTGTLFDENNKPIYRRWHNTLFLHLSDTKLDHFHDHKKKNAALFGQRLIIDLGFEELEQPRTSKAVGIQLAALYSFNYHSSDPFDLIFSSFNRNSKCGEKILQTNTGLYHPQTMISLEEKSFDQLGIPIDKLVYVTSFSRNPYRKFSEDDVIVLPGIPEVSIQQPLPLAKAKKLGVRAVSLPFDDYVAWKVASKALTNSHVINVLINYKTNGRNWRKAFLTDPVVARKVKTKEEINQEELSRISKWHDRKKTVPSKYRHYAKSYKYE
jgi:hypothetical protein